MIKILGEGSFSIVYEKDDDRVVKEEDEGFNNLLRMEARVMRKMSERDREGKYVVPVYSYEEFDGKRKMEMMRLKISLGDIMRRIIGVMDVYSVKNIGVRLILNLQFIHSFGICHGDIKPDNVMLNRDYKRVYFVDFGLHKNYMNGKKHVEYKENVSPTGTLRFMSKNVNGWKKMSRRDDLISLGYMMIYLQKRSLPWQDVDVMGKMEKYKAVCKIKEEVDLGELCRGCIKGMEGYMGYCYGLGFEEKPDYGYLVSLF
jgi:serine/threonine protein kinase